MFWLELEKYCCIQIKQGPKSLFSLSCFREEKVLFRKAKVKSMKIATFIALIFLIQRLHRLFFKFSSSRTLQVRNFVVFMHILYRFLLEFPNLVTVFLTRTYIIIFKNFAKNVHVSNYGSFPPASGNSRQKYLGRHFPFNPSPKHLVITKRKRIN